MSALGEVLVGLVILVGLVGIVVPVLPGTILIFAAVAVWAWVTGGTAAWTVFGIATVLLVLSGVVKYTWPGRRMREAGVPMRSLIVGGLLGIVGFFVIPVVGLFIGFIAGVYVAELPRQRNHSEAWRSTVHATKAAGLSILVELFGALLASAMWLGGAVLI
ncbi:DUF456 domain-containing protein [Rhodococcus fascians]|nr:DUF456 domain-containing protein [Rhodococcus fascians]MBY4236856.1 DUF456 domain-containing protein [Rhodococcus fascians]MBY4252898.1 DUF456 domain-containing protein [Rhodococcus fascians]MBY4268172.1 DUF456 domain-containing protein [Rhodococcus fascians]